MNTLTVNRNGRHISIDTLVPAGVSEVEYRIFSDANTSIIEYNDISPFTPSSPTAKAQVVFSSEFAKRQDEKRQCGKDLRFPVVDVVVEPGMQGILEICVNGPGRYAFNGGFYPEYHQISNEIKIPADHLEQWENAVLLDPNSNTIKSFSVASTVVKSSSTVSFQFETLRDDWSGEIKAYDVLGKELIGEVTVSMAGESINTPAGKGINRQRLADSLSWSIRYLLGCKNTKADSRTSEGLFLLYDLAAKTRLRSDWPWSWGPAAKLFMDAANIPEVDAGLSSGELKHAAVELAEATLRQRVMEPKNPARGLVVATIEPSPTYPHGFREKASTADTLYLAGWGWMPFYRATGDRKYLNASIDAAAVLKRLMNERAGSLIPQAYDLREDSWLTIMSFETSMGLIGMAELCTETRDSDHRNLLIDFADLLINTFETEDGLWGATLNGDTGKVAPVNYWTKAFGYIAEGLLAAHKVVPDRGYLERAKRIADHVHHAQAEDGSWPCRWDQLASDVGVDDKATSVWALVFLRLYKTTGTKNYLRAGTKALEWCMDHQYFGEDAAARGGIVGRSWPSGIIYRHWFDMITSYTMAFFGNAVVEALSLDEWQ